MTARDPYDDRMPKSMPILGMTTTATTLSWTTFKRDFLNRTVYLGDAHTYLDLGEIPRHRLPQIDDLLNPDGSVYEEPAPAVETQHGTDGEAAIIPLVRGAPPPHTRRRFPDGRTGEVIWKEQYLEASAARRKQKSDCATMWSLLFNSMDKTIETTVLNNRRYDDAYLTKDILWLWQIMHMEATGRDALLSVSSLLGQLAQLVQTGNFDEYVRSFRDLVDELASSAELPTRLMLRQMFIGGLDKDENRAWKEKYLLTSEANRPATYEIVIEDIRSYHMQRISLGIITEATNQKGSTRDGDVQAYAAGPQPQQSTRKGKKNPGNCWNCGATECPRGKRCKTQRSAYCQKCNAEKWHKTENHDTWLANRDRIQNRAHSPVQSSDPAPLEPTVRAPPALRGTPHLNYALQQGDAFGAMIRIVPDTELHRVPYGINISPRDWHNANGDNESTESEDGSVPDLVYVDTDDHVPNSSDEENKIDKSTMTAHDTIVDQPNSKREDTHAELQMYGVRILSLQTKQTSDIYDTTFVLDSGCVGGHLLTTPGSHLLLSQSRRATGHSLHSVTGKTRAEYMGYLPLPGIAFYAGIDTVNLLSLDLWEQHDMRYVKSRDIITVYSPDNRIILTSHRQPSGLYTCSYRELQDAGSRLHSQEPLAASTATSAFRRITTNHTDLSTSEIERAHDARSLHENSGHPSDGVLSNALDNGNLRDCNLTSQDIRNMRSLFGPCQACFEGKATMPRGVPGLPPTSSPGELLHIDLLEYAATTLGGYKVALVALDDYTGYISVTGMRGKHANSIKEALLTVITFFNQYRHPVRAIMMDPEHALTAQGPHLAQWGIRIVPQIAGLHEKEAERSICTLKDRERTITAALTYVLPVVLCGERRSYAAERMNSMPNRNTAARTPTEIITGTKPLIPDFPFGKLGLFYHSTVSNGDMQSRADTGIIVGFNKDARNKYRVYFPLLNKVLTRGAFQPLISPPQEWGYLQRLRLAAPNPAASAITAAPASPAVMPPHPLEDTAGPMPSANVNVHIQTGVPLTSQTQSSPVAANPQYATDEEGMNQPHTVPASELQPTQQMDQPSLATNQTHMQTPVPNQTPVQTPSQPIPNVATAHEPLQQQEEHIITPQNTLEVDAVEKAKEAIKTRRQRRVETPATPVVTRSGREIKINPKYLQASLSDVEEMYLLHAYRVSVSQSLREHPDHTVEAIKNEIEYMIKYEVMIPEKYETIPHDLRRQAVPAHMFLKEKYLPDGAFDKLKARLVAGGNWQAEGTYGDTSFPYSQSNYGEYTHQYHDSVRPRM